MNAALRECSVSRFRTMLYTDLREVLSIEKRAHPFAWTDGILRDCIRAGYRCRVLENPHSFIQAYGVMAAAAGEAHLLNLCVRPELQGRGLARRMLDHLLELARSIEVKTVFLEVRPSNDRAVRLYSAAGFCEIGLRLGYYPAAKGREDALVMAKEL
ncbi:MAG: ribosomal protein S18-alanine N-acetyltransferase [Candidatus Competibacter sp.]|nr:ribosomal protein S18-alanine N-acetyltransferase [Candidatus Competibacter sp.]MDG4607019.1 ribosomal protein S18-alanine N-acetyltransferase [Candidatus Contendobacter sp.]HRD50842.1 ribosomal protein S18-alanine N-acetyltransferase [Candidatus Contendobacter sp.]